MKSVFTECFDVKLRRPTDNTRTPEGKIAINYHRIMQNAS